jgi:hypothetical protein
VNIIADAETGSGKTDVFGSYSLTEIVDENLDKFLTAPRMI